MTEGTRAGRAQHAPELPAVVAFREYARFVSRDASENRQRFYVLSWQPSLFGGGVLMRTWGRIGSQGMSRTAPYPDRASAQTAIERLVRRCFARRYELVAWE
jgi:predicted DNA-binding WGR domain protein